MNSGDTSWVIVSATLVMFMTPGLGFFYGGMVAKKNMLSTIGYCFIVYAIVSILWALVGFSLVYGKTSNNTGFIGDCTYCALR